MCPAESSPEEPRLRWLRRAPAGISVKGADAPRPPRLGVLSGTFNPPTRAHLALAEAALAALALEEVLFVLPEVLPHKDQLEASLEAREEMLLLAIARNPKFSAGVTSHGLFLDIHRAVVPHFPTDTRTYFLTGRALRTVAPPTGAPPAPRRHSMPPRQPALRPALRPAPAKSPVKSRPPKHSR